MTSPSFRPMIVMGVSGSGKSTIALALAEQVDATFIEGDDLHSVDNKAKMAAGVPLDDRDRGPWLEQLAVRMRTELDAGRPVVVACSALKRSYRNMLVTAAPGAVFIHLVGSLDLIATRQQGRRHEYMPLSLLESQFATLERPGREERHIDVDASRTPSDIVRFVLARLPTLEATNS